VQNLIGTLSPSAALGLTAALGYLLGSIPFGLVLTRLSGYGDVRAIGSGNIGATNVLRTGSKPLALAVLLLDAGKGALAVLIAILSSNIDAAMMAGVGAMAGHLFPIWLRLNNTRDAIQGGAALIASMIGFFLIINAAGFQWVGATILGATALFSWGGKGVATGLGVLAAVAWPIGVAAGLTWLGAAAIFRRSSVAALAAFAVAPTYAYFTAAPMLANFALLVAILVFVRHKSNIAKIWRGEEPKIGAARNEESVS
jgi:glycerol-3-phosphate acyltransferase PlsY